MTANNRPTDVNLVFTDDDLSRLRKYLATPLGLEDKPVKSIVARLLVRLEAAENMIDGCSCDEFSHAPVCGEHQKWLQVTGKTD